MQEILSLFDPFTLWVYLYMNAHTSLDFILNIILGNLGLKFAEDGSLISVLYWG
jgi:hypothetical protein